MQEAGSSVLRRTSIACISDLYKRVNETGSLRGRNSKEADQDCRSSFPVSWRHYSHWAKIFGEVIKKPPISLLEAELYRFYVLKYLMKPQKIFTSYEKFHVSKAAN